MAANSKRKPPTQRTVTGTFVGAHGLAAAFRQHLPKGSLVLIHHPDGPYSREHLAQFADIWTAMGEGPCSVCSVNTMERSAVLLIDPYAENCRIVTDAMLHFVTEVSESPKVMQ